MVENHIDITQQAVLVALPVDNMSGMAIYSLRFFYSEFLNFQIHEDLLQLMFICTKGYQNS